MVTLQGLANARGGASWSRLVGPDFVGRDRRRHRPSGGLFTGLAGLCSVVAVFDGRDRGLLVSSGLCLPDRQGGDGRVELGNLLVFL